MKFINIHTHNTVNSNATLAIVNQYPNSENYNSYFSIGIHPWYINKEKTTSELILIEEKLLHKNCLAIGECGLDKLIEIDFNYQIEVFKQQIEISEKYKKPLILHCVKSFQEIIQLKKEMKPIQPWIIHGFNKNTQVASSLIKNGFFLSFGKSLLKSIKLQEALASISLEKIFLETDDSTIVIEEIYKKTATIKGIELEKLKEIIYKNFNSIFIK